MPGINDLFQNVNLFNVFPFFRKQIEVQQKLIRRIPFKFPRMLSRAKMLYVHDKKEKIKKPHKKKKNSKMLICISIPTGPQLNQW